MSFIEFILKPVFQILDFEIKLPINFSGETITFPLKLIFILYFVAHLIYIIWTNLIGTEHSE